MTDKHILLFENEKGLERIISLILRQAKMKVSSSNIADRALDIIRSASDKGNLVSAAIIDISSPDPEGERLLAMLQKEEPPFPTIVITQYGNENNISGIRDMDNLTLLAAPFEPNDLFNSIRKVTHHKAKQKVNH